MKQGRASSSGMASTKVEPVSKGVNPAKVAMIGVHQVVTRAPSDGGRGYKAPMAAASTHKCGSQGKH
jgi:hypothetical protein